jgi:hypothetical protein
VGIHCRQGRTFGNGGLTSGWVVAVLLTLLMTIVACSSDDPVAGVKSTKEVPSGDDAGTASYTGTGTVTLSKNTVANQCSAPVDATLIIDVNGVGHLTLDYRNPISDQVVEGEELRFICVNDGDPQTRDYRAEGVDGRFAFEAEFLVSGGFEAVVAENEVSLSGQLEGGSNVWAFIFESLEPVD